MSNKDIFDSCQKSFWGYIAYNNGAKPNRSWPCCRSNQYAVEGSLITSGCQRKLEQAIAISAETK